MLRDDQNLDSDQSKSDESINLYAIFFKYFVYWPWFVASVLICLVGCYIYLRYQAPVYNVSSAVLIKENDKRSGNSANNPLGALQDLGMFSMTNNFDNEVEILKSRTLIKKVVNDLGLYIGISEERTFGYNTPLYKSSPVNLYMTPEEAEKLEAGIKLRMIYTKDGKLFVKGEYTLDEIEQDFERNFDELPAVLPTPVGVLSFTVNESIVNDTIQPIEEDVYLAAYVGSPTVIAENYAENLSVEPASKTTTIALLSLQSTVKQRGIDFINRLIAFYNQDTNDEKNEVAQKTAEFIDERIGIISKELGSTEQDLENFKRSAGITDLSSEAQIALTGNAEYEKKRVENQTQINLVMDLQRYMKGNEYEVLPSNIGLQDAASAGAIDRYNQMLVERKRLLRTSTENNPTIINLDTSIRAMRTNVQATLDATLKGLQITKEDLAREASRYSRRINDAPTQERQFVSIARQQEIKSGLYLMLLQKREENAITLAATANNAKIIDEALADDNPISPKKMLVYLAALVLGVGLPVGVIYLIGLTKFKIEGRADVEKLTSLPVVGDIPLADEKTGSIAVFENQNNLMSETFRNVRTNLQFMLENGKNVILVTSTISGEGKSFISANLAISLSLLGKKVVIVGLDIRKPGLNKVFNIPKKEHGITQYLTNTTANLMDFVQPSDINKNLFILPGGTVPPNPTELFARGGLEKAIETLKANIEYVI